MTYTTHSAADQLLIMTIERRNVMERLAYWTAQYHAARSVGASADIADAEVAHQLRRLRDLEARIRMLTERHTMMERLAYWTAQYHAAQSVGPRAEIAAADIRHQLRRMRDLEARIRMLADIVAEPPRMALTIDMLRHMYNVASAACDGEDLHPAHLRSDAGYGHCHWRTQAALLWQQLLQDGTPIARETVQQQARAARAHLAAADAAEAASENATTWGAYLTARAAASVWDDALCALGATI